MYSLITTALALAITLLVFISLTGCQAPEVVAVDYTQIEDPYQDPSITFNKCYHEHGYNYHNCSAK